MLGTGLQFGRSRGEDRFYNPAKARSARRNNNNNNNNNHNQNQNQNQDKNVKRAITDVIATLPPPNKEKTLAYREQTLNPNKEKTEPVESPLCNLDRFLVSVVPSVPAQYLSKTTMRGLRTCDVEFQPYFVLGDLWESFKEWSAYGVGVPLLLNDTDLVVQYYVPYLSGIQLYGQSSKPSLEPLRRPGEESDDSFRDSSSDGSSDCEQERVNSNYSRGRHNYYHQPSGESPLQEGFSSDEGEIGNTQGSLLFEYLEQEMPFSREPLTDKISDLARNFPGLKTLRSCDLLPSSWISVSWYPIYRIPTGPTLRDLDACFLTFHSLHTPMTVAGTQSGHTPFVTYPSEIDGLPKISLPIFGLSSYKFKGSLWTANGDCKLMNSLLQAANNWLMTLQVHHPDFYFFGRR